MNTISPTEFKEAIKSQKNQPTIDFINVCSTAEYNEKHIPGVRCVPLDELSKHVDEFKTKEKIYVHCRSGRRGGEAVKQLSALGVKAQLVNLDGGLLAWDEAGFATASFTNRMPIMQQTLLAAGSLILLGFALSLIAHPLFIYLSVGVGAGLTFAGLTGWCGMTHFLALMPWNK